MTRGDWSDLPNEVQEAIQRQTGEVIGSEPAKTGEHSDITASLTTVTGRVFIKGMRTTPETPDLWSLRREARINPHVHNLAPRLLLDVEAGGWRVLGFEHVEARHADYCPGSADLATLAKVVTQLQEVDAPSLSLRIERRWEEFAEDVSAFVGDCVIHADLNGGNVLIGHDRPYVVDWGFVSRGAAWIEVAILIQWLIKDGHSPREAEAWASQFPAWTDALPRAVTLFSEVNAMRWQHIITDNPAPWALQLADITQQWAAYRGGLT